PKDSAAGSSPHYQRSVWSAEYCAAFAAQGVRARAAADPKSAGRPRTPKASPQSARCITREASGVRRIPPLSPLGGSEPERWLIPKAQEDRALQRLRHSRPAALLAKRLERGVFRRFWTAFALAFRPT